MLKLNDKVAIITGSGRGNGRGMALCLADHGAAVVVADINVENAENVAKEIKDKGGRAIACRVDVTDPQSVKDMVELGVKEFGPITTLVNNAGVIYWKPFMEQTLEEFEREVKVNLTSVFIVTQIVAESMIAYKVKGSIVNLSSMAVKNSFPEGVGYGAAKGGVAAMTLGLAGYLAPNHIRVNAIAPGPVPTGMNTFMHDPKIMEEIGKSIPLGRVGNPYDDIGRLIAFLASDEYSGWMTGAHIPIDGGKSAVPTNYDPEQAPIHHT